MPENAKSRLRIVGPSTARGRFRVIFPLLRFRARLGEGKNPAVFLPPGAKTFTDLVACVARRSSVSERQVFRWLDRFDRGGYAALAEKRRRDRGTSKVFSSRPLLAAFVVTRYVEGWNVVAIHESMRHSWGQLCPRGNRRFPHIDTLRKFLKSMIPPRALKVRP